jgi:hypothetical protein
MGACRDSPWAFKPQRSSQTPATEHSSQPHNPTTHRPMKEHSQTCRRALAEHAQHVEERSQSICKIATTNSSDAMLEGWNETRNSPHVQATAFAQIHRQTSLISVSKHSCLSIHSRPWKHNIETHAQARNQLPQCSPQKSL